MPLEYMPFVCSVTLPLIIPAEDGVDAVVARPEVVGWLFQFTTVSTRTRLRVLSPVLGFTLSTE